MKKLQKTLFIAIATLGLAATAYAEKGGPRDQEGCPAHAGWQRPDPEKMGKFLDKRLAHLHDKLKISEQQEPAWTAFAAKLKPLAPPERPDFAAFAKLSTPERLDRMQALGKVHQEHQAAHAAAVKEYYATLSPEQQKTFDAEFLRGFEGRHPGARQGWHEGMHEGMHGRMHEGPGRPEAK